MDVKENKYVSRVEFWGMMIGVFLFIFAVQMAPTIRFKWFHRYITVMIVLIQIICVCSFVKHYKAVK